MNITTQLAKNLKEVYFGGNWTASNLQQTLSDVTWQQATTPVYGINTIATLVHHLHYYVRAVTKVLEGEALNSKDELSFSHPPIHSSEDWKNILDQVWKEGQKFADLIEKLPEDKLWQPFTDEKYGIYYRNLSGIIEHIHYHLGQIVVVKKILNADGK